MFLLFSFCLLFSACFENENAKTGTISGQSLVLANGTKLVKWEGRHEFKEADNMMYLYYTATGFTVEFVGTKLDVTFYSQINNEANKPYYQFALDDEDLPNAIQGRTFKLNGGEETIALIANLENTAHTLKCLKMSEAADATTAVKALKTDGYFVPRDEEDDQGALRFMFVCASGGSGHGSLYYNNSNTRAARTTANSSSLHAFNFLTARMFGADSMFVAQSGWGVKYPKSISSILDYSGITTSNSVSGAKTTAVWDNQSWVPDVIIFNIGGNDTTSSNFDEAAYKQEVVAMVKKLHGYYPNANMIWTHTNSNAGRYAMSAITSEHLNYIVQVVIPQVGSGPQPVDPQEEQTIYGYGANNHNSIKTHIATAQILADALHDNWGYTARKTNITFEQFEGVLKR